MSPPGSTLRARVVATAREMLAAGLVEDPAGNLSARTDHGALVTPTGHSYRRLAPSDLVEVDQDGHVLSGRRVPSRDTPVHLAIYGRRPEVGGIVHTHSTYATAWSFLGLPLAPELEDNRYLEIGTVRTIPPGAPGSPEARQAAVALGNARAMLLQGHGVVAVGPTVEEALRNARAVERQAIVAWLLRGARTQAQPGRALHWADRAPGGDHGATHAWPLHWADVEA